MSLDADTLAQLVDTIRRYVRERLVPLEEQVTEQDEVPVAAQLGVSLSTLYAYVDTKGPRERATELLSRRAAKPAVSLAA